MATLENIFEEVQRINEKLEALPGIIEISGNQVQIVTLDEMSESMGLLKAGEFRSGNGRVPGDSFSGVRIGYPPMYYPTTDTADSARWNIAGVDADTLQFGLRASDGVAVAGAGAVVLGSTGLNLFHGIDSENAFISWYLSSEQPTSDFNFNYIGRIRVDNSRDDTDTGADTDHTVSVNYQLQARSVTTDTTVVPPIGSTNPKWGAAQQMSAVTTVFHSSTEFYSDGVTLTLQTYADTQNDGNRTPFALEWQRTNTVDTGDTSFVPVSFQIMTIQTDTGGVGPSIGARPVMQTGWNPNLFLPFGMDWKFFSAAAGIGQSLLYVSAWDTAIFMFGSDSDEALVSFDTDDVHINPANDVYIGGTDTNASFVWDGGDSHFQFVANDTLGYIGFRLRPGTTDGVSGFIQFTDDIGPGDLSVGVEQHASDTGVAAFGWYPQRNPLQAGERIGMISSQGLDLQTHADTTTATLPPDAYGRLVVIDGNLHFLSTDGVDYQLNTT